MKALLCFLVVSVSCVTVAAQETQPDIIANVSVPEFRKIMDSLQSEVVLDLRTPEELQKGRIPGAMAIDFFGPDFEPSIQALDKNKTYLLYCASGGRSGETSELMQKLGFRKVYNMEGGFTAWTKARMPIAKE